MGIRLLPFAVILSCFCEAPFASADTRSFNVQFAGCTEFVGWGPVSLASAQPLVPAGYVIAGAANGQAAIVVRATSCEAVSVDQSPAQPTDLSQIGINLVTPDGTGDINNYTVIYVTNKENLARRVQTTGLPAVFDPQLTYEYTTDSSGVREATVAQTPVIEKPGQRPATHSLFDAAGLISIESIGAGSDIRAFLAPGVPRDLMLAALRRAWSTDPAIRDFIGLSENSWDFNASDGIPGFGPLITDGAGRLAAEATGNSVPNVSDKSATELNPSRR